MKSNVCKQENDKWKISIVKKIFIFVCWRERNDVTKWQEENKKSKEKYDKQEHG